MDTKTPPIPLKSQEKPQSKKVERAIDVSLPPLTSYSNYRVKSKSPRATWSQNPPCAVQHQDHRKKKPYKILYIGATPLMHACQQSDRARVLRLLKEQEETIAYRDRTLRNALHYCMDAGTGGAVAAAAPELVNAPDAEGHTPLHLAVIAGDTQLVAVLLANGADVNAKDLEGHSVLHWATVCGEAECVRLVLAAGARPSTPDLRGGSPLHYAAQCCGAVATAELAVPKKIGLKVLQTLLEFGADVNAKDEDGRQPILWAASAGSVEAVLALARAGGSAAAGTSDKDGLTALHCAASRGHARCVEVLVNLCGSHLDHVDDNGCSALHYAATLGHADATALILKLGADPNRQDRKGRTPALCAAAKGQLETLKILTQHGGSLHAKTVRGTGIGHEAVASGRIELIKWLAKKRPSTLDVAMHDGKTPLHVAALHGYLDACKILLDHGAKINAVLRTSKGNSMTPLDAALYRGHRDCAKLIQMHGGSTAQQLKTHKIAPNKAKFRMKHRESSTASDSSPCRRSPTHKDPELYYEEQWIERRTQRKSNLKKLARRDSRSLSEEKVRLSKTALKRDERRARSESARYENNSINSERNIRRKRCRQRSTRHKYECSDSSAESGSCSYSYDSDKNEEIIHRQTRKRQDKNKDNLRKEDDDRSVSDDSLEVIVVKKSLEKKCEKVISGRRSQTPRCTKETKLTKMHKRKKMSRSVKSRTSDNEDIINRNESLDKEEKLAQFSKTPEKDEDDNERVMESQYQQDMTDSTSQETVEQVIVTAMVHKDQMSDTPKSNLKTTKKMNLDASKNTTIETEDTKEASRDISLFDKNKMISSHKTVAQEASKEKLQRVTQESSQTDEKVQDEETNILISKEAQQEEINDKIQDRLNTFEDIPSDDTLQKVNKDKTSDKLSYMNVSGSNPIEDLDILENEKENKKLFTPEDLKIVEVFKTVSSKQSDAREITSDSKDNAKNLQVNDKKKNETKQICTKAIMKESSENIEFKSKKNKDLDNSYIDEKQKMETLTEQSIDNRDLDDSVREKSTDLSSTESRTSMLNVEKALSLKRTDSFYEKKSDYIQENDGEQPEDERESKDFRYDDSSSSSPKSSKLKTRHSRPSTGRNIRVSRSSSKMLTRSSEKLSSHQRAIVAVIDGPEWDEAVEQEIRAALGKDVEHDTEHEEDNEISIMRVLPSTSEGETPSAVLGTSRLSGINSLPRVQSLVTTNRFVTIENSDEDHQERLWRKQRRDSGGRDSGIEPSPRVSRIPRRQNVRCCPNTAKQQALNMETITRDVQISLRRYHLERKIFFQLMELKRLQIRHGRANEHVLVKRQVEAFNRSGMTGPTLGVVKYDRPLTFRQFEAFLYEQLRRLQGRPTTSDFCTEAKQCTQKTHRCHHATSAYTCIPVYTYLGGGALDRADHLPKIESRGKGQMTVEVTHGEEKQVIALPTEKLDRTKKYFVTFTVRGETQDIEKPKSSCATRKNAKSV